VNYGNQTKVGMSTTEPTRAQQYWDEAEAKCSDLIRNSIKHLRDSPEWRLEVADETGNIRHLFRLTAEPFDQ
jgi:hypothetical protein